MRFEDVIAPLTLAEFTSDYWGKKPLFIRGNPDKFESLFSLAAFRKLLQKPFPKGTVARAVFDGKGMDGKNDPVIPLKAHNVEAAYMAGATFCMDRIHERVPALEALTRDARVTLGFPGPVFTHAYWSPDGAGFRPHFDARITTTLQLDGSKTWRYTTEPAIPWPRANARSINGKLRYFEDVPRASWELATSEKGMTEWKEITLHPGDVLCLPAGCLHQAEAKGHSFAVNLNFNPLDVGAFASRVLARALAGRADYRHMPPMLLNGADGGGPSAGQAQVGAVLDEMGRMLQSLARDPARLSLEVAADITASLAADPAKKPKKKKPEAPRGALDAASTVRVHRTLFVLSKPSEPVVLVAKGNRIEPTGDLAIGVIRELLARRTTKLAELNVAGYSAAEVIELAGELESLGVIEHVG